jgi:hypothetical protein
MIFVIVNRDGLVEECISVDSIAQLEEIYTEHKIIERTGDETVGWKFDGVTFTAPPVW